MASSITCPRCGAANTLGTLFCVNCGSSLTAPAQGAMGAPSAASGSPPAYPPVYPGAVPGAPSPWDMDRQKNIDRTRTGILILLIGALISAIPFVGGFGSLFTLIGAILVILGRKAFGVAHRRNVLISIVVFCLGIAIFIVGTFVTVAMAASSLRSSMPEAQLAAVVLTLLTNILIVLAVGLLIVSLASVFFTYALQKREGKLTLFGAYGATVAIRLTVLFVALPLLPPLAAQIAHLIITSGTVDPTSISNSASNATQGLELLNVIPALLYAAANYFVWSRIKKGEIPAAPTPPGMPPTAAPIQPR